MKNNREKDYQTIVKELYKIEAEIGLPEEIFLAVSSLMPIPNVDLLIRDKEGRILLSWRDDIFFGTGWHIPGGCIRFKETMLERVQETARSELHTEVLVNPNPLAVRDVIIDKEKNEQPTQKKRAHHLAVLYECYLPKGYDIDNGDLEETDVGYLKWFKTIPDNILKVHDCYKDILIKLNLV